MVGSLEILGSPGGLAQALGSGLRDFVSLPFQGLLQGPWGFIVGITHGSASLMKHITAGDKNLICICIYIIYIYTLKYFTLIGQLYLSVCYYRYR